MVISDDKKVIQDLKVFLAKEFEKRIWDFLKYFLGMLAKGICVSQHKYILDLLKEI